MDEHRILLNPSQRLWAELVNVGVTFTEREREAYALGKLAVLLELETHVRIIEEVRGATLDDSLRFTVSSALRAIQRSLQRSDDAMIDDVIDEWYRVLLTTSAGAFVVDPDALPSEVVGPESTTPPPPDTDEPDPEDTGIPLEEDDWPT